MAFSQRHILLGAGMVFAIAAILCLGGTLNNIVTQPSSSELLELSSVPKLFVQAKQVLHVFPATAFCLCPQYNLVDTGANNH